MTDHISVYQPTTEEIQELRRMAADWQRQFHEKEEQLDAANARIAELRKQFIHEQALLNAAEHEISLCARAEEAERKLATARTAHLKEFLDLTCKLNPWIDRDRMEKALAKIEQPQEKQ